MHIKSGCVKLFKYFNNNNNIKIWVKCEIQESDFTLTSKLR